MPVTELQTPFGAVRLIADGGQAAPWRAMRPVLPEGQRVDACRRADLRRAAGDACSLALVLEWEMAEGFVSGFDSGEGLEASTIEGPGLVASVGLPDGVAIDRQPGVRLRNFSGASTRTLYEIDIAQGAAFAFPAAAAWTLTPTTEAEEIAPWFAIDFALTHKD